MASTTTQTSPTTATDPTTQTALVTETTVDPTTTDPTVEAEETEEMDLATLLAEATSEVEPRVIIPAGMVTYLDVELKKFLVRTNRYKQTLNVSNAALAKGILVNRPTAKNLTGTALLEAAAKEFGRQVRQYAADHKMSASITRTGSVTVYRLVKPSAETSKVEARLPSPRPPHRRPRSLVRLPPQLPTSASSTPGQLTSHARLAGWPLRPEW